MRITLREDLKEWWPLHLISFIILVVLAGLGLAWSVSLNSFFWSLVSGMAYGFVISDVIFFTDIFRVKRSVGIHSCNEIVVCPNCGTVCKHCGKKVEGR